MERIVVGVGYARGMCADLFWAWAVLKELRDMQQPAPKRAREPKEEGVVAAVASGTDKAVQRGSDEVKVSKEFY